MCGLHRAMTSAPSKTFGMNRNTDLWVRIYQPTSVMELTVSEWEQIPATRVCYSSTLIPMVLKWRSQKLHMFVYPYIQYVNDIQYLWACTRLNAWLYTIFKHKHTHSDIILSWFRTRDFIALHVYADYLVKWANGFRWKEVLSPHSDDCTSLDVSHS